MPHASHFCLLNIDQETSYVKTCETGLELSAKFGQCLLFLNLNQHEVKSTSTSIKWEGFLPELLSLKISIVKEDSAKEL